MSKLVLDKNRPSIDLRKSESGVASGDVLIHTEWDLTPRGIDLDLGVMWKATNGHDKGVIQALGKLFGSRKQLPYLQLEGDDQSGGKGETIRGDYAKVLEQLEWFGVYLYIYGGAGLLSAVRGAKTTVTLPGFKPVEVVHEDQDGRATAILQCHNTGDGFKITRDSKAFPVNQSQADRYWGVGLTWGTGSK